jgi:glycerol-3-phosphate acyltransferase PlsY
MLPLGVWLFRPEKPYWAVALIYCALVVWLHRSNIVRLLKGTESKLSFGDKK